MFSILGAIKILIVANSILIFKITINPTDLQCPFVIRLANIKLELSKKIQTFFQYKTAIINPIALIKFFHII